jgi:hypothetical protein
MTSSEGIGPWRTSSHSGANGDCVEIADRADGGRLVRDSKNRSDGSFDVAPHAWDTFLDIVKSGKPEM